MVSRSAQIVSSVIIGRESELNTLEQALHAARQGQGRCVLIAGEAGGGKSSLLAELRRRALTERFVVLQGNCFEQDAAFPYAPWIDALRASFAPLAASDINELLGSLAPEFVKLLPELSLLLPQIQPTPSLEPEAEKRRRFESLARFIANLSASNPLLIAIEDLHWSDELSLELLHFVVRRIANLPVLLLGTLRTEELSPRLQHQVFELNRERLTKEIRLAPLTRGQVEELVRALLKTQDALSTRLLDLLERMTEGNPFFVQELLKSWVEVGDISHKDGHWELQSATELPIPRSIQDVVQRRMEQLPGNVRRIVVFAAVVGQRFDFGLLQEVVHEEEQELLQALKELIVAQLIIEESADQFAFRHALTREAVYARPMRRERKAMHQTIGETIERLAGARTDAQAAQLAYHFYQGGVWQKAMEYSQRAGEQAQALYAPREAVTHFTHALDAVRHLTSLNSPLLVGEGMGVRLLRGRAHAREVLGEFDGAWADYEAALESARHAEDRVNEWQALIDLGLLWQSRDLKRAGEYYQLALELARNLGDSSILAQTLNRVGNWHMNLGRVREALPYHREALALFEERDDRRGMAATLDLLGLASYPLGEAIQGAAYLEQALPILRELDDRQGLVNTLTNLTLRALMDTEVLGQIDFMELTKVSDEALQIARGFNWYHGEALALLQAALSLKQAGEYGQALARLAEAKPLVDESQNRESLARLHLNYGQVFTGLLALSEARQHFETGLTQVRELGSGILILGATAHLASVALLQNDLARAQALLAPLLPSEYPEAQEPFPLRVCWSAQAELELKEGRPGRALEIVDRLFAFTPNLAQYGPHAVPRLSRLRALALVALDRMDEAKSELQGTLPLARAQGLRPLLWRLHADLGNVYRTMRRREDAEREFSSARTIIQDLADRVPEGALRDNFLKQALAALPAAPALTQRQIAKKEFGGLTAREREIALLIAQGKSNREIADELVISETTAERHVANILSKLGFNSRTQIAVWAVEKGLGK
jgi:DNA-binding CsgD family transcriptional regulator